MAVERLAIGGAAMYRLPILHDTRGDLTVAEVERDVPFVPRRYFTVYDVPPGVVRGGHAHLECAQWLTCVAGSCWVDIDDGSASRSVRLDAPHLALYLPPMVWAIERAFTPGAALLVLASQPYLLADYIREYSEFVRLKRKTAAAA